MSLDQEVEKWESKIRDPRKWLPNERFVTWILTYHDMTLLITKISDIGGTMITIEKTRGGGIWVKSWLKSHTPEELLEVLHREVPLIALKLVHSS